MSLSRKNVYKLIVFEIAVRKSEKYQSDETL